MSNFASKRVVVTGTGLVSPLGATTNLSWERLIRGESGIRALLPEMYGDTPVKIGGRVPNIEEDAEGGLDLDKFIPLKEQKKGDRFIHLALVAAEEALQQAGLLTLSEEEKLNVATIIATGIGGFHAITNAVNTVSEKGSKRMSPFTVPSFIANLAAAQVSIKYGFKGISGTPVSACAASVQAIGDGFKTIMTEDVDIAVVGGSESCINAVSLGGFNAARALTIGFNDAPEKASRPFDAQRSGFVMSEGAGVLVLEELEHAKRRGATILAEVKGYGTTSDAWHITAGPEDGEGAARAMSGALKKAEMRPEEIDYINAHSTSTPVGDKAEIFALKTIFGDNRPFISSTKSATGHMLGAAGAAGAIFSIKALNESLVPASLNIEEVDEDAQTLNIVKEGAKKAALSTAMVNGFGFGGVNASVIFSKYQD